VPVVEQDQGGVLLDQAGHAAEVCDSDRLSPGRGSPIAVPGTCIAVGVVGTQMSVDVIRRSGPAAGAAWSPRAGCAVWSSACIARAAEEPAERSDQLRIRSRRLIENRLSRR
jgi:hypothetical protein